MIDVCMYVCMCQDVNSIGFDQKGQLVIEKLHRDPVPMMVTKRLSQKKIQTLRCSNKKIQNCI